MKDLTSSFLIKVKGILFLVIGIASAVLVLLDNLEVADRRAAGGGHLELLPLLLFCILRHREIRGSRL